MSASEWRKLTPLPRDGAPRPPLTDDVARLEAAAIQSNLVGYGPARAGQAVRELEIPNDGPIGFLADGARSWTLREVAPSAWGWGQLLPAYRAALKLLRRMGLPRDAYQVWCFRDAAGAWWALVDDTGGDFMEFDPAQFEGLGRLFFRSTTPNMAQAFPERFAEEMGGDGALEWAWWVVGALRQLRDQAGQLGVASRELQHLMSTPEWSVLQKALARRRDAVAESAIWMIEKSAVEKSPYGTRDAFVQGFELGQGFGVLGVTDAIRRHERGRLVLTRKLELRAAIRAILVTEAAKGILKPYVLAKALVEERGVTERGKHLARLGLAASEDRVGRLISGEARDLGLLP